MVKRTNIGNLNLLFVFRHRFEKTEPGDDIKYTTFREWRLGLFYRKDKIVGRKDIKFPSKWKDNMCSSHMIGIDLLLCKMWITIDIGGMHFKMK